MKHKTPNIPPEELFRILIQTPRPIRKMKFELLNYQLYVQAISSVEISDNKSDFENNIILKSVVFKDYSPVFSSINSIKNLMEPEYNKLKDETFFILSEISPILHLIDAKDWYPKLEAGARHPSNYLIMRMLGNSYQTIQMADKIVTKDTPEEYFNIPKKELIDCHLMAYWAAKKVYQEPILKDNSTTNEADFINALKQQQSKGNNETRKKTRL